jgi:putative IMPACT (imprinted ancient) family translation regulator
MAEDFVWSIQGHNKHHFTAFGNLLALRNGGQVEPASLREDLLSEEQSDDDSDSSSVDTNLPQSMAKSGYDALKKSFWIVWLNVLRIGKEGNRLRAWRP